jgi:hypothetical protein
MFTAENFAGIALPLFMAAFAFWRLPAFYQKIQKARDELKDIPLKKETGALPAIVVRASAISRFLFVVGLIAAVVALVLLVKEYI